MKQLLFVLFCLTLVSCSSSEAVIPTPPQSNAFRTTKVVEYDGISVKLIIDKPENNEVDVLMVFRGTVMFDHLALDASRDALDRFKALLNRKDVMIVSVVYPEEGLLFGDNVAHAEAGLLWLKNEAEQELGIQLKKIALAGHSQGGYIVTRLNTMHQTAGVVANAPGPLNLEFRCRLEENGQVNATPVCDLLFNTYGSTLENPEAYRERSLLFFTNNHQSKILFFQGMNDGPIQMHSYPVFKTRMLNCTTCAGVDFFEMPELGHAALFQSGPARAQFNIFLEECWGE